MTSGESAGRNGKRGGTTLKSSVRSRTSKVTAPDKQDTGNVAVAASPDLQPSLQPFENPGTGHIYAPSFEEIKSELWRIATGDGTESSRVSALRALADIMGLTKPAPPDFPEGMTALLDALSEGLGTKT